MMNDKYLLNQYDADDFDAAEEALDDYCFEEDARSNAPCDTSGICAGRSCPLFYGCQA